MDKDEIVTIESLINDIEKIKEQILERVLISEINDNKIMKMLQN